MSEVLRGFTVGVTAHRRSEEQISLLTGRGATCLHGPTIQVHPLRPEAEIAAATELVIAARPAVVVATTGIGFRSWLEAAETLSARDALHDTLSTTRIFTRGPKAHGAVVAADLDVEWTASAATTDAVFDHLVAHVERGATVAVQLDGDPEPILGSRLRAAGYEVIEVPVYRWTLPSDSAPAESLVRAIIEGRTDAVTFTARPAIDNLLCIAEAQGLRQELLAAFDDVLPVCVGPVCAARAVEVGMGEPLQPTRFRLGAMVQQLTDALVGQVRPFRLAGTDLELRGSMVSGGSLDDVMLAGRERETLVALLERPGVVYSKKQLLSTVWGAVESDPHVVEVTVGRLRRRLGAHGEGIETVMRRGYRAAPE